MPDPASHPDRPAIRFRGVTRSYGSVVATRDVTFDVRRGEVVGLLGPNGAGKTTALRMLATLIAPDEGSIEVDGVDVCGDPAAVRRRLGYQTGDTGLYDRLTPREFIHYFGRLHGIAASVLENRVTRVVEDFGIADFADRLCGNLSTGQKQRVSLARTFVHDPPVLALDEPTSGLDIVSSSFILQTLRAAAGAGRAVLFSTHVLGEVELICDRIVLIHRGCVIAQGTIADLLAATGEAQLSRAFLALIERTDTGSHAPLPGGTP